MRNYEGTPCKECGAIINEYSRSGFCRKCWHLIHHGDYLPAEERISQLIERHQEKPTVYHFVTVSGRQVPEHRYVWEKAAGKKLPRNWIVHHLNGLKGDNRPENLAAMPKGDHDSKAMINALKVRIRELEQLHLAI